MAEVFRIREFQFYDSQQGYSRPPADGLDHWHCTFMHRRIRRSLLVAYIDEIKRVGGRSWLYIQAVATDVGDTKAREGVAEFVGQHIANGRPLLDAVAPNAAWAARIAPQWAGFAASLRFSGIHWDTLGYFNPKMRRLSDISGFLRTTQGVLRDWGLAQTFNFADGFGWDASLLSDDNLPERVLAFPYMEVWTVPRNEKLFFETVAPNGGGVFVCYPGRAPEHLGEPQNRFNKGVWPLDLLIMRWRKARASGNTYLAVGDGLQHVQTMYLPLTSPISGKDVSKIVWHVFGIHLATSTTLQPLATTTEEATAPPPARARRPSGPRPTPPPRGLNVGLQGEYGYLTQFDGITEEEARARVRRMADVFGIREFQLYDAQQGYSRPPADDLERWHCTFMRRPVRRDLLLAYVDEIRKVGGRSWFYVQATATDLGDTEARQGFHMVGQHIADGKPLLDVVAPNSAWALHIAPRWAGFAASLGVSGIHWDTLGYFNKAMEQLNDLPGFLRAARGVLRRHNLAQTFNFADGFGWEASLLAGDDSTRVLAFPYMEVWTVPKKEDMFFNTVAPHGGGVFVCYPGQSPEHGGEPQNRLAVGIWPLDLLIARWRKAHGAGNAYLAIGDGLRHVQTMYLPMTSGISGADIDKVLQQVFGPSGSPLAPRAPARVQAPPEPASSTGPEPAPAPAPAPAPEPSTTAPATPPGPGCGGPCTVGGYGGTCRSHMMWAAGHQFQGQPTACFQSHRLVISECPECASCQLAHFGCGPGQGNPGAPLGFHSLAKLEVSYSWSMPFLALGAVALAMLAGLASGALRATRSSPGQRWLSVPSHRRLLTAATVE